jgi:transglutaminase-like putative cysteine protease
MRIKINHSTTHTYDVPVRAITQVLRLVPRDSESQQVASWRIALSTDGRTHMETDAFGNAVQRYETDGPLEEMTITVEGIVDTFDTAGILRGVNEPVPPEVFLRHTPLTAPDEAIIAFAEEKAGAAATPLEKLHILLDSLHERLACEENAAVIAGGTAAGAAAAFAAGRGLPRDLAHVFIACARHLDIPARIVTGYHAPVDMSGTARALHAWAEAYAEGYGWIGFDVATGNCPTTAHVRIACGLDYADVTPVRGARKGGGREAMTVMVMISGQQ